MKQRRKLRSSSMTQSGPGESDIDRTGKHSRIRRFKVVIVALSVLLFVALDLVFGSLVGNHEQQSFRIPHSYYHHALLANQNRETHWGGRHYKMITNSLGFRDGKTRDVQLQRDRPRVLIIGDSMMEGLGVEYEETVAGQLEEKWASKGVEVLNAGAVSYSPHLYHLKVRYLLEEVGLQFSQLIVFIDISDIQDETFYETFQPAETDRQPGNWWRGHSLVFRVVDRLAALRISNQFRTDAEINEWMETTEAYHAGRDPEIGRWEWTVNDAIYEEWGKKGLALARKHLAELNNLCIEHRIKMTVVVYPSPVQIYANDQDSRQVRFWREFCDELDLTLIDLFPTFIDYSYAGPDDVYKRYFLFEDSHWNAAGHRVVASKLDDVLGVTLSTTP